MSSKAIGQSAVLEANRRVHCGFCGWVVRPGHRCGCGGPGPTTRVVNVHQAPTFDVFIGRPSKWGNPFVIGRDGTREQVIVKFYRYLIEKPELMAALGELQGKTLGCFCSPLPCHGQVLARLASELPERRDNPLIRYRLVAPRCAPALEHEDPETRQRIDRGYAGPIGLLDLYEELEAPKYRECIDCGSQDQLDNFGRCEMCSDTRRLYRRFG